MLRSGSVIGVLVMLLMVPGGAGAQNPDGLPSDPNADSPSGTIYELPLDSGRKDAAPRKPPRAQEDSGSQGDGGSPGGGGAGGGQGGSGAGTGSGDGTAGTGVRDGSDSSIRSENNFGSSSKVPGVDPNAQGSATPEAGSGKAGQGEAPDLTAAGAGNDDGPSWGLVVPLIALLLLVGGAAGTVAGRARRA